MPDHVSVADTNLPDAASQRIADRLAQRRVDEGRARMIDVAESLHSNLSTMNLLGDRVDTRIATQAPGCPYGDVHSGLTRLCMIIWGDELGPQILADTYNCGTTLRQSAMFFINRAKKRTNDDD